MLLEVQVSRRHPRYPEVSFSRSGIAFGPDPKVIDTEKEGLSEDQVDAILKEKMLDAVIVTEDEDTPAELYCPECDRGPYKTKEGLAGHIEKKHPDDEDSDDEDSDEDSDDEDSDDEDSDEDSDDEDSDDEDSDEDE